MGYFDKWYSWLFTPVSSMFMKTAYGLRSGVNDIIYNDSTGTPRSESSGSPFGDDDWNNLISPYSSQIQSLRDAGYSDQVDAILNQWRGTLTSYSPGWLDSFFGSARTGKDKWYENVAAQLGESLKGLSDQRQMNEFNAPIAQSARERQAGINSDLLGTGDVAGAAAPAEDTNNVLPDTAALTMEGFQSYGQFLFSLPSLILGIARDSRSLKSISLANEGQRIANDQAEAGLFSGIQDVVKNGIIGAVDENDVDLAVGDDPIAQEQSIRKQLSLARDRFLRSIKDLVNPRLFKSISKSAHEYFDTMDFATLVNEGRDKYFKAKVQKSRTRQSKFVGGNDHGYDDVIDVLNSGMASLIDLKDEFGMKLIAYSSRNQSQYQQTFGDLNGPSITAQNDILTSGYQTEGYGLDVELKKLQKKMTEAQEQMVVDLKNLADGGNTWARIGLYLINAFRIVK